MRHLLLLTSAFLLALTAPALVAQAPPAWSEALNRPSDNVHVQARLLTVDGKPCIQFHNAGPVQVSFHYAMNGRNALHNPRVHLNANKDSACIPLPAGTTVSTLKLTFLRKGPDQGSLLAD